MSCTGDTEAGELKASLVCREFQGSQGYIEKPVSKQEGGREKEKVDGQRKRRSDLFY